MDGLKKANLWWILLALTFSVLSHYIRAIRWKMMFEPIGYKTSAFNAFNAVMAGYLFNFAIPRMGEVSRCAILYRTDNIPVNKSFGTVVSERIFDLVIMLILFAVTFFIQFSLLKDFINNYFFNPILEKFAEATGSAQNNWLLLLLGVVVLGGLAAIVWFIAKRTGLWVKLKIVLKGFAEGIASITKIKRPGLFILYTLLIWLLYYLTTYICFFALDDVAQLGPEAGLTIFILGSIGIIAPVSGGIGAFHFMVAQGLILYGIDAQEAGVFAFLLHTAQMVLIFALGGLALIFTILAERKRLLNEPPATTGS